MTKKRLNLPLPKGAKPVETKKILALHFHPTQIRQNIDDLIEQSVEMGKKAHLDPNPLTLLLEDVKLLVGWALDRLPLIPPPTKRPAPEGEKPAADADAKDGR